jgi:CRP-like cAMP-binding protein
MISLLTNMLQLDAVSNIILLSRNGALLYSLPSHQPVPDNKELKAWRNIFEDLGNPQYARFVFDQGSCSVFQTALGFVGVVMKGQRGFKEVRTICTAFDEKSVDFTVRKTFLLHILFEVNDHLKLSVIDELVQMADKEIGMALVTLLQQQGDFDLEVRDKLLISLCRLIGDCSAPETMDALAEFIDQYTSSEGKNPEVEQEAKVSLQQLEFAKQQGQEEQSADKVEGNIQLGAQSASSEHDISREKIEPPIKKTPSSIPQDVIPESAKTQQKNGVEQRIKDLLAKGKKQEAVSIIMKYIEAAARQKMFDKAEKLRDTLIKIDSMMLAEIIRAAEIIEEHKAASIDPEDQETWTALTEILSTDEFTSLYHAMTRRHYSNGETVVEQGMLRPQLLFINSGQVQLFTHVNGSEVPLKTVGPGEVIGGGTFFEASVWTVSVRSQGAELLVLSRKRMEKLVEKHTSLESRLIDFSARFVSANVIFRKTKRSRRRYERKSIVGRAAATLLSKDGKETDISFKGDLFDISRGGLSFVVRVSRKKNANMLFGSRIRVGIPVGRASSKRQSFYDGKVVAVRGHHVIGNEYSLHVQFDEQLSHQEVQQALGQS